MAKTMVSPTGDFVVTTPKKTRQGSSVRTKIAPTSRNSARKRYRGQGRWLKWTTAMMTSHVLQIV